MGAPTSTHPPVSTLEERLARFYREHLLVPPAPAGGSDERPGRESHLQQAQAVEAPARQSGTGS